MNGGMIRKLSILYLLIISLLFLLINTVGTGHVEKGLVKKTEQRMYNVASTIVKNSLEPYYNQTQDVTDEKIKRDLMTAASVGDCTLAIISESGVVVFDSSHPTQGKVQLPAEAVLEFTKNSQKEFVLKGLADSPHILESYPIMHNYVRRGYLCALYSCEEIENQVNEVINDMDLCYLIVIVVLFLAFVGVYLMYIRPVKKCIKIAKDYSEGNFDIKYEIKTNDEFVSLAELLYYMGDTMNRFDEYQRKIIANISHDFRSPLTSIKGYAEAIKDGTIPTDQIGKYLDIVLFEVERLTKLTSNLLTLNTFDKNGMILQKTNFDINAIARNVAQIFEGTCEKKHITIRLLFSKETLLVHADSGKIEQVIYNLVDNAIKFSHADGEIRLFTEEKGRKAMISIQDEGAGIQKVELKKVWDRFYKSDSSRGKDKKGTGLGLSIVKEIVTAHEENINVISTVGVGTEFVFTLPLAASEK